MACDKALEDAKMYYLWKGREEGSVNGKIEAIKNIMQNLQISVEKALSIIGVPESEWNMYIAMIDGTNKKMTA